jgi:hypothetical protein
MNGWKADPAGEECEISTTHYHCPALKATQLADVSDVPAASIFPSRAAQSCTLKMTLLGHFQRNINSGRGVDQSSKYDYQMRNSLIKLATCLPRFKQQSNNRFCGHLLPHF